MSGTPTRMGTKSSMNSWQPIDLAKTVGGTYIVLCMTTTSGLLESTLIATDGHAGPDAGRDQ